MSAADCTSVWRLSSLVAHTGSSRRLVVFDSAFRCVLLDTSDSMPKQKDRCLDSSMVNGFDCLVVLFSTSNRKRRASSFGKALTHARLFCAMGSVVILDVKALDTIEFTGMAGRTTGAVEVWGRGVGGEGGVKEREGGA